MAPCCIKDHFPKYYKLPTALEFSEEITTNILYNLNLTSENVNSLYNDYMKEDMKKEQWIRSAPDFRMKFIIKNNI